MANLFVHFKTKAAFTAATLGTEYTNNSIVFIQDSLEIWTHGTFYAIPETYKNKIKDLETAVSALLAAQAESFAVRKVKVGEDTFTAAKDSETVEIVGENHITTSVDAAGKITIKTDLNSTSYFPNASGATLEGKVKALEDAQYTLLGDKAVVVTDGEGTKIVSLKLDTTGNVTLTLGADGLKANIGDVTAIAPVQGVAAGEKVIALNADKKLTSTLKLNYVSTETDKKILLLGIDNAVITELDATAFIKDGMLDNATFNTNDKILTLTFNTASGKEAIPVDLSDLVDSYDGSNLKLKSVEIPSADATEPAAGDSVDTAVANLIKKDRELKAEIDQINTDISDILSDSLVGIEKGTDGKFVTTTISNKENNKLSVGVAVTTKAVADATEVADGLATAYGVQSYVTSVLAWAEFD